MPNAANGWAGQPPPTWQQGYGPQGKALGALEETDLGSRTDWLLLRCLEGHGPLGLGFMQPPGGARAAVAHWALAGLAKV